MLTRLGLKDFGARRIAVPVMLDAQEHYEHCSPGGGTIGAHKIMLNLYRRFRVECHRETPKYNDDILKAVKGNL